MLLSLFKTKEMHGLKHLTATRVSDMKSTKQDHLWWKLAAVLILLTNTSGQRSSNNDNDINSVNITREFTAGITATRNLRDNTAVDNDTWRKASVTRTITDNNDTLDDIFPKDPPPRSVVIGQYVSYVITPLFLAIGISGNVLTIIVMFSREFKSMTTSVILIALAISDTGVLLIQPFNKLWLIHLIGMDIRALSDASCKIFFILFRTSKMCSSWFVVVVCMERMIAVWFPLKARLICTKRNAVVSLVVIFISILIFNILWSFSSRVVGGKFCFVNYKFDGSVMKTRIFAVVGTVIYAGIPTTLLCIMTPAIICRLAKQTRLRKKMSETSVNKLPTNHKTFAMLVSVMIAYILLATPIVICMNIALIKGENLFQSRDVTLSFMREIAQPLELLNYSVNFILYIACSKVFRCRVAQLFCCRVKSTSLEIQLSNVSQPRSTQNSSFRITRSTSNLVC